ncbi:transposase [Komagataeibacter diospyri]|uniref:transposase n=1 Tax=Komagataeibacter diospyri TaxID=1932662 RepID=UPI003757A067
MFFQRADGNAEESRRIGRAQETGRQPRLGIKHDRTSGWVRRLSVTTAGHGEPWRDLPTYFGHWNSVYSRYSDWMKAGVFKRLFDAVSDDADMEYAMIDGTVIRVHRHGQGAKGGPGIRR